MIISVNPDSEEEITDKTTEMENQLFPFGGPNAQIQTTMDLTVKVISTDTNGVASVITSDVAVFLYQPITPINKQPGICETALWRNAAGTLAFDLRTSCASLGGDFAIVKRFAHPFTAAPTLADLGTTESGATVTFKNVSMGERVLWAYTKGVDGKVAQPQLIEITDKSGIITLIVE